MIKDIPFSPDPTCRPPKPVRTPVPGSSESTDINPEINIYFEENSPFQDGVISKSYHKADKSFFQEPLVIIRYVGPVVIHKISDYHLLMTLVENIKRTLWK